MFLSACRQLSLEPPFSTVDLYEDKAPSKVIRGIAIIARHVSTLPTWTGVQFDDNGHQSPTDLFSASLVVNPATAATTATRNGNGNEVLLEMVYSV